MLPILLDIGFIKIYTFGVFMVLAFFWGAFLLWKHMAITSFREDEIFDGLFLSLLGGLIGGRIEYIALHFSEFGWDILKFILVNGYPGIGLMGYVFGFFFTFYLYALIKKEPFPKIADYLVSPFLLALAIGKLGAFFSGAEMGTQTSFIISLSYKGLDGARHLTPLYESILYFCGSFFAYKILRSMRRGNLFEGFNLIFFVWYFSLICTLFDPISAFRIVIQGVSVHMVFSGVLLLTTSTYLLYYVRQSVGEQMVKLFSFKGKK